jgi:hypothetical protein
MTTVNPAAPAGASQQAAVDAALLVLERMGLAPADLLPGPREAAPVPTFAQYVPVVAAAVTAGTRRAYGSYWNRITEHWGDRRLDEITPSEVRQLMAHVKANVVARRNARGGRSAAEHLVAALRCLYARAEDDGLITPAGNPARKVAKPRRLPSTRRAVPDTRLAEINHIAATTGNDPELDTLLRPCAGSPSLPPSWPGSPSTPKTATPPATGNCCATPAGSRSPAAATTTCGPGSEPTCPGPAPSSSAPTGSGTPR